ncbi:MAG: DEAD/DEAH box helicase, partial [Planctomycetota bacterium]
APAPPRPGVRPVPKPAPGAAGRTPWPGAAAPPAERAPAPPPRPKEPPPPKLAPISFGADADSNLLEKLLRGPHDDLEALVLARRGAEILAEDRYDRLLSLPTIRGVEHMGYQIETVLRVLKRFRGRVLLADEVGLGKTIEACLVLKEYMVRGQVRRALILVPPALVGQWKGELEEKFGIAAHTTQDPEFRKDPEAFWKGGPVLLASIAVARGDAHRGRVLAERFDMVVIDEAHHLKNRSTRAWELANGLRSRFCLMLTATPVETNLSELYNLVTLLRPGTLGTDREFRGSFVRADDPTQPKDPEKLRELLREVMVRNTRARCGVLLPPRTAKTLVVEPTPAEGELYRLVVEETRRHGLGHRTLFRVLLEEAGSSPLAVAETASRSRAEADPELASSLSRIEEAARAVRATTKLERLPEVLAGGKVLLFSRFRATMDQIAEELGRRGILFAPFHGDMSAAEKDRAVEAFRAPGVDVLLCSEIGGEGRNLQFCHRLVNFDLPWNPMKIEQRIGRIHRIGQKEIVEVVNLAAKDTAEERILDVLDRRVNLFELVVGEMDLLLGERTEEREFEERVFDIYATSRADADIEAGFQGLTEELLAARGRLEKTKALDAALFGEDYEA